MIFPLKQLVLISKAARQMARMLSGQKNVRSRIKDEEHGQGCGKLR